MTATGRVTASPAPPSRRRDFGQYVPLLGPLASRIPPSSTLHCDRLRFGPPVSCAVNPHAVQDYSDLASQATFARFEPRRLATSIPQRLSFENRVIRDSRTLAAS